MHRTTKRPIAPLPFLILATLAAPFSTSCSSSSSSNQATSAVVLDPTQAHYGHTDTEWGTLWWQWIYQTPQSVDDAGMPSCIIPFLDPTGANCAVGQSGDVFFLAGTQGGTVVRDQCAVPSGKALFFPIFTFADDNAGVPAPMQQTNSALMGQVQAEMAGVQVSSLSAEFDGATISNLGSFATPVTEFTYQPPPEPNIYTCQGTNGVTSKVDPSYQAGYYVMLAPPAAGAHVLHFAGTSTSTSPAVKVDVTYHFTIQ
jgi:hypothetical protein